MCRYIYSMLANEERTHQHISMFKKHFLSFCLLISAPYSHLHKNLPRFAVILVDLLK